MSFLPPLRFSPVSREHVEAPGPSAPPLELCLDFRGSLRGNVAADNAEYPMSHEHVGAFGLAPPLELCLDFRGSLDNAEDPATSRSQGSLNSDREKGGYTIEWENLAAFEAWRQDEERIFSIELKSSTTRSGGHLWSKRQLYVCGRERTGGGTYTKKNPEREPKIGTRKTGCRCQVVIKSYPHTPTILGRYLAENDHEIGSANIAYTRLSGVARERIKTMFTQKIDRKEIVSCRNPKRNFSRRR